MKLNINHILLLTVFTLVVGCKEDEESTREFPRLNTLEVTNITSQGATFNAEFRSRGDFEILSYGFTWREDEPPAWREVEPPTIELNDRVISEGNIDNNRFNAKIETTLKSSAIYVVRAFVETAEYVVYGEPVSFISLGSAAPQILAFEPTNGSIGDTISLKGQNFSYVKSQNIVKFNEWDSEVVRATDSLLRIIVPQQLNTNKSDISVSIVGNIAVASEEFELNFPTISSVNPTSGTDFDEITIIGEGFTDVTSDVVVYFDDIQAEIISNSINELKVKVPAGLTKKDNEITVVIANQNVVWDGSFVMNAPIISSFSPTTFKMRDVITINGENFNSLKNNNKVVIGGQEMFIRAGDANTLEARITSAPNNDNGQIEVINVEQTGLSSFPFTFKPPKITTESPLEIEFNNSIIIEGEDFSPLIGEDHKLFIDENEINFWSNNPNEFGFFLRPQDLEIERNVTLEFRTDERVTSIELNITNPWVKRTSIPCSEGNCNRFGSVSFSHGEYGFIGLGQNPNLSRELWRFNPENTTWARMADFPGEGRYNATSFILGDFAYIGGGISSSSNAPLKDFYRYDIITNTWSEIAEFPFAIENAVGLSDGVTGYIATKDNTNNFWSYDPSLNEWSQEIDLPITDPNASANSGFELEGQLYLYVSGTPLDSNVQSTRSLYRFNPLNNTWIRLADVPDFNFNFKTTSFSIGEFGYLIDDDLSYAHRYDPSTDSWETGLANGGIDTAFRRYNAISFIINGKAFFGGGREPYTNQDNKDLWEYDPTFDEF